MVKRRANPVRWGGFMLLDAIVATLILAIALVTIVGLNSTALSAQRDGESLQDAAMLADELLEQVVAVGPDRFRRVFGLRGSCEPPFEAYSYEMELRSVGSGDPYSVAVTILWDDLGESRSLRFETLIAPRLGDDPDPERAPETSMERP
jgi:type II secretory pathway component PulJ